MSETKHTPGPWEVDTCKEPKGVIFIFAKKTDIAVLYKADVAIMLGRRSDSDDIVADAQLIAAAPDLLDALKDIVEHHAPYDYDHSNYHVWCNYCGGKVGDYDSPEPCTEPGCMIVNARAAIAKATGGDQ